MPIDIESQIVTMLQGMQAGSRPATLNDLARRFGVSSHLITLHAQHLVDDGRAQPSFVTVSGVDRLHGLLPQSKA